MQVQQPVLQCYAKAQMLQENAVKADKDETKPADKEDVFKQFRPWDDVQIIWTFVWIL